MQVLSNHQRLLNLSRQIRCPSCRGQSIAESDTPASLDLREQLATMLNEGYSDASILVTLQHKNTSDVETVGQDLAFSLWLASGLFILACWSYYRMRTKNLPSF